MTIDPMAIDPLVRPSGPVRSTEASAALLARGSVVTPGGVNTARRKIDPPVCFRRGYGAYLEDVDGNRYIDYHAAYGPIILGHSTPAVSERVARTIEQTVLFGVGTTELEVSVAETMAAHIPSADQVLFCCSGTESTFHAIRLARGVTGRQKIIKFQGHYHGGHDYVLRNTISQPEMIGKRDPASQGMLDGAVDATIICRYNDLDDVAQVLARQGEEIAAVIVEPIAHNSPSIEPADGFLEGLRELTRAHGSLLIFDEIITGIRHHLGGYQAICGVMPDITCMGKAIANGFPLALVAGPADLMAHYSTTATGGVAFAGTYNGGAVGLAAAQATLDELADGSAHKHMFELGERMRTGLRRISQEIGVPTIVSGYGSLYIMLFMDGTLNSFDDVPRNDTELFVAYRKELVRNGIFEMPENIGRNHISAAHTADDVDYSLEVAERALRTVLDRRARQGTLS